MTHPSAYDLSSPFEEGAGDLGDVELADGAFSYWSRNQFEPIDLGPARWDLLKSLLRRSEETARAYYRSIYGEYYDAVVRDAEIRVEFRWKDRASWEDPK